MEGNLQEKTYVFGERSVPVPICPPQNLMWSDLGYKQGLRSERPLPNRLSNCTPVSGLNFTRIMFKDSARTSR